ncbi:MAG: beta-lactamase family protein, partial [Bacteroidetes bacterium]|nr:beta-lactamase family protein [Bacteroidota bacterium]
PEIPDFGTKITLRHLAHHTSGLRDQWNLLALAGWRLDDVITLDHVMALMSRQKDLNFEPGEEYLYCNSGFTLLAEIVARVSGKSFAEFTRERIFTPLKMNNTLFYVDHEEIVPNRAYSYYKDGNGYKKSVLSYANAGATSLFTTVEDLSLWAMNFETPLVGDSEIIEKMNTRGVLNNGEKIDYALGQRVDNYKGLKTIGHGGADAGYRTQITRFPDQKLSVIVFSNLAQANPSSAALAVADLFLGQEVKEENVNTPKETPIPPPPANLDLSLYEATYWNERGSYSRKIYQKEGILMYNRGGENESPLAPLGDHTFKMLNVEVDLIVEFGKNAEGKNNMLVYVPGEEPNESVAYEPAAYSTEELQAFSGRYYSAELETFYQLIVENDQLIARHIRHGNIAFEAIKEDYFSTTAWFMGQATFQRNRVGEIKGMKVSSGRVRNIWFEKVN